MPDEQSRFAAVSACAHKPHILSCLFGSAGRQACYFNSEANGMLEYLRIRDLALIEDMELEFGPGINALTGETGAGKSFILKAISFLLGDKLSVDMVRPGRERAQVEALFAGPDGDLILRRELVAETGRSRFFLNGDLSSQETVRELRPSLVLHAGQHGQQRLLQPAYQAFLVDSFMASPALLERRDAVLKALRETAEQRRGLQSKVAALRERRELLEMQQKEIDKVAPEAGEEERLEAQRAELRGFERLREQYDRGLTILRGEDGHGLLEFLNGLERVLETLTRDDDTLSPFLESLLGFREEAQELDRLFRRPPLPAGAGDPEELEARLYALAQLKRKLRRTLPEILSLKEEIEQNLSFLDSCGLDIHRLEKQELELAHTLSGLVGEVNGGRRAAAETFCRALENELAGLGFSDRVHVEPEMTAHELWPTVGDVPACVEERVRLLWAPNPGQPPQPLDRIASGGELSRFLLAVVGLQAQSEEATLIFDEVDAGVGGITLNRVAERLDRLAGRRQMLLITHWPQLAARAERHFRVTKEVIGDETFTRCQRLAGEERDAELARMAGRED